jgi:hypothetical protein
LQVLRGRGTRGASFALSGELVTDQAGVERVEAAFAALNVAIAAVTPPPDWGSPNSTAAR